MSVTIIDNGPIKVSDGQGTATILDMYGKEIGQAPCYLCRCGHTANAPFCDGAHKGKFISVVSEKKVE